MYLKKRDENSKGNSRESHIRLTFEMQVWVIITDCHGVIANKSNLMEMAFSNYLCVVTSLTSNFHRPQPHIICYDMCKILQQSFHFSYSNMSKNWIECLSKWNYEWETIVEMVFGKCENESTWEPFPHSLIIRSCHDTNFVINGSTGC